MTSDSKPQLFGPSFVIDLAAYEPRSCKFVYGFVFAEALSKPPMNTSERNMTPHFNRPDYFCEDSPEFLAVLCDMSRDFESLALSVPADGMFLGYRERLFAAARELAAIEGGLRAVIASQPRQRAGDVEGY